MSVNCCSLGYTTKSHLTHWFHLHQWKPHVLLHGETLPILCSIFFLILRYVPDFVLSCLRSFPLLKNPFYILAFLSYPFSFLLNKFQCEKYYTQTSVVVDSAICCLICFRNEELSPRCWGHGQQKSLSCEPPVWMASDEETCFAQGQDLLPRVGCIQSRIDVGIERPVSQHQIRMTLKGHPCFEIPYVIG